MKNIRLPYFLYLVLVLFSTSSVAADYETTENKTSQSHIDKASNILDVYKNESCSCCEGWIKHLDASGFKTTTHVSNDMDQIKSKHGISPQYQSCHTAVSKNGYVFEGHVPAQIINQFLANPPKDAIGLAVPGMPIGSPGMEMGNQFTPYDVLLIKKNGSSQVYAHIATLDKSH